MKTEKIEKTITLTDSISTKIILNRKGQQDPRDGNEVVVKGELHLPTNRPRSTFLHNILQFSNLLKITDEELHASWGRRTEDASPRYVAFVFNATTWKKAFEEASVFFEEEVQKLVYALEARKQALIDAEEE